MRDGSARGRGAPAHAGPGTGNRLSRDQVDMGWLWKELGRFNVDLVAEDRGKLGATEIALYGLLSAEQRKTLMVRSQWARKDMVAEGRSPTGACYGYRVVRGKPGVLAKYPAEAKTVVWMFEMRAAGLTLSGIARSLNERQVPSPSGRTWKPTLVKCILTNPRYRGKLLYRRTIVSTDSSTTERTVTKRPMEEWIAKDCQKLRIVGVDLWDRVQAIGGAASGAGNPGGRRRGPYMLSGHVHCPGCGSRSKIVYTDTVPRRPRMGCASAFGDEVCNNRSTFLVEFLQVAVVDASRSKLDRPDAIQAYLDALNAEHAAAVEANAASRQSLRKRIARLDAQLMETLDPERTVGIPIEKLYARRVRITEELTPLEEDLARMPSERAALSLDPSHFRDLRAALDALAAQPAIRERDEASRRLIAAVRLLVGKVVAWREPGELGFRGTVEIRAGGFVAAGIPGSEANDAYERVDIAFVNPPKAVSPERTALNLATRTRDAAFEPGSEIWGGLAERLPAELAYGPGGATIDTRVAVATMVAALRLDRPFSALAPGTGGIGCKGLAVVDALVCSGLWGDGRAGSVRTRARSPVRARPREVRLPGGMRRAGAARSAAPRPAGRPPSARDRPRPGPPREGRGSPGPMKGGRRARARGTARPRATA